MSITKLDKNKSQLLLNPKHLKCLNNQVKLLLIILKIIIWF